MPTRLSENEIRNAEDAVAYARHVRKFHAKRTERRSPQRATDIALALQRLREAMKPLRSEIGRFPCEPCNAIAEQNRQRIRDASAEIQKERRKLWKMKDKTKEIT
jgi:hypothetical protein